MNYIKRLAEERFQMLNKMFQAVLVCGPRQVGKTTMLKRLAENTNRTYVTLDDMDDRYLAINDPKMFFQKYKTPILIDEVQYAPNLFSYIKIMADNNQIPGEFWLSGSQSYKIMKNVSESLAGRIGIMNMYSLLYQETLSNYDGLPESFDFDTLVNIKNKPTIELNDIYDYIFKGGMPRTIDYNAEQRNEYFKSYIETFLMKDVMELGGVADTVRFRKFLSVCATQNSNVINYANLAMGADVSEPTAKEWLSILQGMGIVYLLQPYYNNELKRLTKTPKMYFFDTGLCAYLAKIPSKEILMNSSLEGAFFENYVVNQFVIKSMITSFEKNIYFYRDFDQKEIDIILEDGEGITPLEVKVSAKPNKRDVDKFKVLDKTKKPIKNGGIVCLIDSVYPANDKHSLIPVGLI